MSTTIAASKIIEAFVIFPVLMFVLLFILVILSAINEYTIWREVRHNNKVVEHRQIRRNYE